MPEIGCGEGESRRRPRRADLRPRNVRRAISAQGGSARRQHQRIRLCRRSSAAGADRQPAALAGGAAADDSAGLSAAAELSAAAGLPAAALSKRRAAAQSELILEQCAAPAELRRAIEQTDLALSARRRAAG